MTSLVRTFVRGLGVVMPVALTIWFVVWLANTTETLLREVFLWFFPEPMYVPGLGVALGIAIIFAAGVLVQVFLLQQLWSWAENLLARIPLVKTVYNAIRDFLGFFFSGIEERSSRVVTVDLGNETRLLGFVTDTAPGFLTSASTDLVAVYLPMSYMVGGYTLLVPRTRVTDTNLPVEAAMRWALTAGIQRR